MERDGTTYADQTPVRYLPGEALLWLARHRGEVVKTVFGLQRYAYLLGPRANAFVFANDPLFRFGEAFAALIPVDGPTSLVVSDGENHSRRRRLVRPGVHRRQVAGYLATMAESADDALDAVPYGEPFDAYELFRSALRRSTMRALFGERIAGHADRVGADLQPLLEYIDRLPQSIVLHRRLRTPLWRRARKAQVRIDSFVYDEIARLRRGLEPADTQVLATLVDGRNGTGSGLSDLEVRDQIVTMIAAGYETTSAAMGWTLYGLSTRPDLMAAARDEVLAVTGGAPPSAADLPRLELVGAVIDEALRLYAPGVILPRYVAEEFEYAGRRIRAGTMALISPYVTHRDPEIYPDPLAFRPERWLADGSKPSPAEYLPFGGGAHHCVGSIMATTSLTVMLARLLSRSTYSLETHRVRARSLAALRPRDGLPIRLTG